MTDLMFGHRVAKTDPRVEANGVLDELNAALGLGRVWAQKPWVRDEIARIQDELILLMGELATREEDRPRYLEKGWRVVTAEAVDRLDGLVRTMEEEQGIRFSDWALPGASGKAASAFLDVARTVSRRGERAALRLLDGHIIHNREVIRYLNRLSDVIWLLARCEDRG